MSWEHGLRDANIYICCSRTFRYVLCCYKYVWFSFLLTDILYITFLLSLSLSLFPFNLSFFPIPSAHWLYVKLKMNRYYIIIQQFINRRGKCKNKCSLYIAERIRIIHASYLHKYILRSLVHVRINCNYAHKSSKLSMWNTKGAKFKKLIPLWRGA